MLVQTMMNSLVPGTAQVERVNVTATRSSSIYVKKKKSIPIFAVLLLPPDFKNIDRFYADIKYAFPPPGTDSTVAHTASRSWKCHITALVL